MLQNQEKRLKGTYSPKTLQLAAFPPISLLLTSGRYKLHHIKLPPSMGVKLKCIREKVGRKKEGKEYDIDVIKKEAGSKKCKFYKKYMMLWVTHILRAACQMHEGRPL